MGLKASGGYSPGGEEFDLYIAVAVMSQHGWKGVGGGAVK